jgi:hypothetical protein
MPTIHDLSPAHLRCFELGIDVGLGSAPLKVLKVMLRKADTEHFLKHAELLSWPSYREIAAESGLTPGGINWGRRALVAVGLLTLVEERTRRAGCDVVWVYRINQFLARDHASALAALAHRRERESAARRTRARRHALVLAMLNGHVYRGEEP